MKKRRFIEQAIGLTLISLVMRGVGTAFMIYVSNLIGAEGIGLYQLTFSVYFLFVTLSTSGISTAVTRIVSEQSAVGNENAARCAFNRCMLISVVLSCVATMLLYNLSMPLAQNVLHDVRAVLSLKILAIGLPFLSVTSTIKGYFLGLKQGVTSATADIVEQVAQIVITLISINMLAGKGIEYACCALVIGSTASEILSCIYAMMVYIAQKKENIVKKKVQVNRKIFSIIMPISVSNYIRSTLNTIENVAVPQGLKKAGQSYSNALAQYGMIKGMVMLILFFPTAILNAFSTLLVPEVSAASMVNNKARIDFIIQKSFKVTLLFAFFVTGIFICYSNDLGVALYKDRQVGKFLLMLAPLVPLMYLDSIVDSILKGLNQQLSSMKYNTVDSIIRVCIILFLVPLCGINGYIIMMFVGTMFNAFMSINRLIVVGKVRFRTTQWVVLPIIAITLSCLFAKTVMQTGIIASILVVALCYFLLLTLVGCIRKRDIMWVLKIFYKNA